MSKAENMVKAAEDAMSAEEFIASIAPITATSGQINILKDLGKITPADKILEIWCGAGDMTAQLTTVGGTVVGTDYSKKLIDAAIERFPDIEFLISESDDLVFPDNSFDVVVSNFTAHHYSEPKKVFGEARRVLKPRGRLLVTMPIQAQRVSFNIVLEVARRHLDLPEKIVTGGPLLDASEPEEIVSFLMEAGFEKADGFKSLNYTAFEKIETLLDYVWKKIGLARMPQSAQDAVRFEALRRLSEFKNNDDVYRFPDMVLAVRGVK